MATAAQKKPAPKPGANKAVATRKDGAVAVPDFMKADAGVGAENFSSDDMIISRLKLMQSNSPELETYNGLDVGDFFHTTAEFIIKPPFRIVALFYAKRYLLWNPREAGGGILARADDGVHWSPANTEFKIKLDKKDGGSQVVWKTATTVAQSRLDQWGTLNPNDNQSGPAATKMFDYVLAFPDHPDLEPATYSFQRSTEKVGRDFNTKLKQASLRLPIFGLVYEMNSTDAVNKVGQKFKSLSLTGKGFLDDQELYEHYKDRNADLQTAYAAGKLKLGDEESLQGEGSEESEQQPVEVQKTTDATGKARRKF